MQPDHRIAGVSRRSLRGRGARSALAAFLVTALALPSTRLFAAPAGAPAGGAGNNPLISAQPGTLPNGNTVLNNRRTITPAGRQTDLSILPLNAVLSPDGTHLLVDNSGARADQSLQVVDTRNSAVVETIPYTDPQSVFVGLAYSADGTRAYASGGGQQVVHAFDVGPTGLLNPAGDVAIAGASLYPESGNGAYPTGLSVSPDGRTVYVADNLADQVSVIDTAALTVTKTIPVGSYPYATAVSPDGTKVYASNWGANTLSVIDTATKAVTATITVGANTPGPAGTGTPASSHPSAMAFGPDGLLFVSLSNSDAIAVVDTASERLVRTISLQPYANAKLSSSPQGLAVSADGTRLYVALAGEDAVAVIGLHGANGPEAVLGRIPTAWYPTAVQVSRDGRILFVTNGKGLGAGPNDVPTLYPDPARKTGSPPYDPSPTGTGPFTTPGGYCNCAPNQYSGSMITGTLSTVPVPVGVRLNLYTALVNRDNRASDAELNLRDAGNPIPLPGAGYGASPIKHVIYVIKENRTYDQVFGDEPFANGDPSLTLFGKADTPNLHALAERFGLPDNFYADAEVSTDGHNWINSANASDYNEKMWPQDYSPSARNRNYDFEGASAINLSPGGYLWDDAAASGISYKDYGEFYLFGGSLSITPTTAACPGPTTSTYYTTTAPAGDDFCYSPSTVSMTTSPNLVAHFDPKFRGFDQGYSDLDRVAEFSRDTALTSTSPSLPALSLLRLSNDHTSGTRITTTATLADGSRQVFHVLTPQAYAAQDDAAVAKLVDLVSHSKDWASTAIFITEDDAQNGPDHVDAHRTESLVVSPYTSRSAPRADHTLYDTAAMVRTIELILGMRPLSQYDRNATPMWRLFSGTPDTAPYDALPETTSITATNTPGSFMAQQSARMDFSREDLAPEDSLNRAIWGSVKGAHSAYPAIIGGNPYGDTDDTLLASQIQAQLSPAAHR